jgi:hypothetical protein
MNYHGWQMASMFCMGMLAMGMFAGIAMLTGGSCG